MDRLQQYGTSEVFARVGNCFKEDRECWGGRWALRCRVPYCRVEPRPAAVGLGTLGVVSNDSG